MTSLTDRYQKLWDELWDSPFAQDLYLSINALIKRHRDTDAWTFGDRQLAIALLKLCNARGEALEQLLEHCRQIDDQSTAPESGKSVNALTGQGIRAFGPLHQSDEALRDGQGGQARLQGSGVDEPVGDGPVTRGDADQQLKFADRAHDGLDGVDSPVQPLNKLMRGRQMLRNLGGVERIGHSKLLTLHGLVTRYVAGAVLTPFQWLHRKAGIRQVSVPRGLSDATPTAGGDAA